MRFNKYLIAAAITALMITSLSFSPLARATSDNIPALTNSAVFTIGSKTVVVDGHDYTMDVAPYIDANDRTQVPVRYLGNVLGCSANWNGTTKTVTLTEQHFTALETLVIGSNRLNYVYESQDGQTTMDTVPVVVPPGRTMLPARYVAQALNYTVTWNGTNKTVTVTPDGTTTTVQGDNSAPPLGTDGGVTPPDVNNTVEPGGYNGNLSNW